MSSTRRVSGSWAAEQITAAHAVLTALQRGADVRVLMRQPAYTGFVRSLAKLKARADGVPSREPRHSRTKYRGMGARDVALEYVLSASNPPTTLEVAAALKMPRQTALLALTQCFRAGLITGGKEYGTGNGYVWRAVAQPIARTA